MPLLWNKVSINYGISKSLNTFEVFDSAVNVRYEMTKLNLMESFGNIFRLYLKPIISMEWLIQKSRAAETMVNV